MSGSDVVHLHTRLAYVCDIGKYRPLRETSEFAYVPISRLPENRNPAYRKFKAGIEKEYGSLRVRISRSGIFSLVGVLLLFTIFGIAAIRNVGIYRKRVAAQLARIFPVWILIFLLSGDVEYSQNGIANGTFWM